MVLYLIDTKTMKTDKEVHPLTAKLIELGVAIECSPPIGGVDEPDKKGERGWPHIAYAVTVARNGKALWSGPYKLGTGHVKWPDENELHTSKYIGMMGREEAINAARLKKGRPNARLLPNDEARAAGGLAFKQAVKPSMADVMHSLILDGSCHFDGETFSGWCANYGHSDDSIKARDMFEVCEGIGKKIRKAFTPDEIATLRELASDY